VLIDVTKPLQYGNTAANVTHTHTHTHTRVQILYRTLQSTAWTHYLHTCRMHSRPVSITYTLTHKCQVPFVNLDIGRINWLRLLSDSWCILVVQQCFSTSVHMCVVCSCLQTLECYITDRNTQSTTGTDGIQSDISRTKLQELATVVQINHTE
jgi:hypothetical protein